MCKALMTAIAIVTLGACASVRPVSPERLRASEQAVQNATSTGADRDPDGAKYLATARNQLAEGKKLSGSGEPARAEKVLERAEVDARLASAVARENASKADLKQTAEMFRQLQ